MTPAHHLRALLLLGTLASAFVGGLHAQLEVKTAVSNDLTYRPLPAGIPTGVPTGLPTGPAVTPTGSPTITSQFANVVETSSSSGIVPDPTHSTPALRFPTSSATVLQSSSLGNTFSSGVPRYFLGDHIVVPVSYLNSSGVLVTVASSFWRAEPIRAGEIVINPSNQPLKDSTGAAIANTGGVIVPALVTGAYDHYYYSRHAKQVFANEPGQTQIWWRSSVPDAFGNYVIVHETFNVSSATLSPVRPLYWTEKTFSAPRVQIPSGRIVTVNAVYSNVFPASVAAEYVPVGSTPPADPNAQSAVELRTLWFETTNGNGELHAYNISGRIMIEYLGPLNEDGSHEFLGADIVEVSQAAPSTTRRVYLGEELRPDPEDPLLIAYPVSTSASGSTSYYGSVSRPDGSLAYYAELENNIEDRVVFYWLQELDAAILPPSGNAPGLKLDWPKYLHKYLQIWPGDATSYYHYTVAHGGSSNSTGTGLKFEGGRIPTVIFQDDLEQDEVTLDPGSQRLLVNLGNTTDQLSRVLLKFSGDNGGVWYVRLMTQADDRGGYVEGDGGAAVTGTAYVGDRLAPPSSDYSRAGYIYDPTAKGLYSPKAYIDPFSAGVVAAESGAIIPVNALPGGATKLEVWWFRKVSAPSSEFADFYTTAKIGRYTVSYRSDNPTIVLASNLGTGDLSSAQATGSIYVQNNPNLIGYNPNEEHALMLTGRAYALRDDLNIISGTTFTSLPRVLVQYTSSTDGRPSIAAYQVLREDATHTFNYPWTAGSILNSPMPLPRLALPVDPATGLTRNTEVPNGPQEALASGAPTAYQKFTFKDRKGYDWVYRGPHANATPSLGMQWYYTMRSGFFIPGLATQPAEGTILPYLRPQNTNGTYAGDPVTGTPLTVVYRPVWPDSVPTMSVGETLALPNHGLPAVRGNTSAIIFYQQSIAQTGTATPSVTLHDPTRAKTVLLDNSLVGLTKLPASAATTPQSGKTYFQLLPPHLQQRFYFDPTLGPVGGLVFIGQFVDEVAGEDYVHLNALSADDVASLKGIVASNDQDYQKWSIAIDNLTTKVETFMEDPAKRGTYIPDPAKTVSVGPTNLAVITSSDTAVDSYALTAKGEGSGYATLLFGNGYAFTPIGDPVSVHIVKVLPQLYTGDLKTLPASNPLDEQTTLRHSGDYAAHPERYEFEWRHSAPVNGVVLPTYTYNMATILGMSGASQWELAVNPSAPLPTIYPTYTGSNPAPTLPRTFAINDASYNSSSGLPGTVARATTNVVFTGTVPAQVVFSANLRSYDGFVLYVNRVPAVASRVPTGIAVPGNLTLTEPRSDLSSLGLPLQFFIPASYFAPDTGNIIEIALYTTASAGSTTSINFRIDAALETDKVTDNSQWEKPNGVLTNSVIVGGSATSPLGNPLLVFSDNYFTMRYRPKTGVQTVAGTAWSRWMTPKLVESWIKRALDGINPFTQRTDDLYNNPVSSDVSILTQAGKRWEGDVALNLNNINDFGLIEIYETLLNRAKSLSIDSGYDDPGTNDTLLLTAGYLNDLYMTLGNEASDDADNPTIAIDGELTASEVSTSRFSFESQLSTLIDEELALLRGRDDFLNPAVTVSPAYNRLYWNYTNGINSGESIYAINYDIKEKSGSSAANGTIEAEDAQYMFPQGHGDAYGHYLTALTGYYKLLASPYFTWTPRSEAVSVLGQTVQVDYQDERKFAAAAAAVAKTAARILDVTARKSYQDDPSVGWTHQRDNKNNPTTNVVRNWGTDEWASRGGQGAYFNWVNANAMLIDKDSEDTQYRDADGNIYYHTGIQLIDRTTVPEIQEIVSSAVAIQTTLDGQSAHLNPLGLAKGAIAFDISPTELKAGKSHFDQVYARALQAALNAKAAFDRASVMNRTLRNQNNSLDDYNTALDNQERAYQYQLIELFGTPYPADVGPGKTYTQGYTGPDLYRYYFIDRPTGVVDTAAEISFTYRAPLETNPFADWSLDNPYSRLNDPIQFTSRTEKIVPQRIMQFAPSGSGSRGQPGAIQAALADAFEAQINARESANTLDTLLRRFNRDYQLFTEFRTGYADATTVAEVQDSQALSYLKAAQTMRSRAEELATIAGYVQSLYDGFSAAPPLSVGLAIDATSAARALFKNSGAIASHTVDLASQAIDKAADFLEGQADQTTTDTEALLAQYEWDSEDRQHVVELERLYYQVLQSGYEISRRLTQLQKSNEQVNRLIAKADQILSEREIFRQRAAVVIQGYRTRDLTYRAFRNEELAQYQALYDLAAQYTYLAVQAYDYETGLLGTTAGQQVINGVVATRSLGAFSGNLPLATGTTGDGGLATLLARLQSDWSVAKSRLGINNPDNYGTLFSLRQELFRVRTDAATTEDDKVWQQVLEQHIMSNVLNDPDVAMYCRNIRKTNGTSVPGIVISFSTTIGQGLNFFGSPLAAGDHAYTASNFATKIYSTGVVIDGYVGMDPYAFGTPNAGAPASSNPNALSATPYVYLIPAGQDSMLMPPLGDTGVVRSWAVRDQAMPLPFNLGQSAFAANQFFTPQGSVNEQFWITRKHQAFRPVSDPAFFYSTMPSEFTNSRLVGRSVWNTKWKLVIPANTLLNNEQAALDRFVRSVRDIRIFFRTYSHSGN